MALLETDHDHQHQSTKPKMHVAVLPNLGMGHIIPLFELAKRLVVFDHDIHISFLLINTDEDNSAARDQYLYSTALPPSLDVVDMPPINVSDIVRDDMLILTRICVIVEESLKSLKSVLIELGKPEALVIDLFCTGAFKICSELSIPVYSFYSPSTAFLTFSLYIPTLDREVEGEFVDLPEPISIPGCSPIRLDDLLDEVRDRKNNQYKLFYLHMSRLPQATGILVNTWEDFEPVPLKAIREHSFFLQLPTPPIYPVGPLIKQDESMSSSDEECLTWMDNQPVDSVLFIALGSGGTLTTGQLLEMAWGLEMSQQKFIWVLRKPDDADASSTFFNVGSDVNDPKSYLPEGFLEKTHGVGLVVKSWATQVAILRHPSTGGFLSHCGWNSTLESITHGVPIIAWPLYAEQKMNAAMLTEEIGVAVKPVKVPGETVVKREEISRVVKLLMESEEGEIIRGRVKKLRDSARRAVDIGGSSYNSLSCLIEKWKNESGEP
ncbi:hypothetical protein EZV62_021441 [Acer yangbiense]|uniref:Glycosyltransferase n=1 Tax=Acer yangbiense TaxID=1000413 RepID=A0A5C7H757_9ROSI|nr:hypothetical protein EZV62_021441 [Acer yangbiense]